MERIGAVLVDTYRIDRLIAEGGMGAVYEASHLRIPKKFAVKFLKLSLLDNAVALQRFRREAEVIATLDHPAIVDLVDYNLTDDGVPYTILEYLEGEHLGDRVNRGRLPLVDALRITAAVSGALDSAHASGVVHRDLKPENVVLCTQGEIKVVDFGIAKLHGAEALTAFNSILGTVTYMAPEQLTGGNIDARADQFALGAMVYEMLSGDMPFGSEGTIPEIAERVLRKQPPPLAGYPRAVFDVVLKAMSKDPAQRYATVGAFNDALVAATRAMLPVDASATPVQEVPSLATVAAITAEEELPELPGEATSISVSPTVVVGSSSVATSPSLGAEPRVETTRITRAQDQQIVGRAAAITAEGTASRKIGRRGGLFVGIGLGLVLALVVMLLLR